MSASIEWWKDVLTDYLERLQLDARVYGALVDVAFVDW
jgi:hypothetical protein